MAERISVHSPSAGAQPQTRVGSSLTLTIRCIKILFGRKLVLERVITKLQGPRLVSHFLRENSRRFHKAVVSKELRNELFQEGCFVAMRIAVRASHQKASAYPHHAINIEDEGPLAEVDGQLRMRSSHAD
ncbi:MAG: hypothetical protein LQ345_000979 [Seirophora villosa]|nr:MAG: hypothetical protein LQ345_000979 [Seirophora villosa]